MTQEYIFQKRFGRKSWNRFIPALLMQDYNVYSLKCCIGYTIPKLNPITLTLQFLYYVIDASARMGCMLTLLPWDFWVLEEYFWWYSNVFGEDINPDLELAWFGCSDHTLALTHSQQLSLMFGMVEAKRVILMDWSTLPPSFHKRLAQIFCCL